MKPDVSLEDQIRDWAEDTAARIRPWTPARLTAAGPLRRPGRRALALAAAVVLMAGAGAWYLRSRPGGTVDVTTADVGGQTANSTETTDAPEERRLLTCGGEPFFPPSALEAPAAPFDLADPVIAAALDNQPSPESLRGRVLFRDDTSVLVATDTGEVDPGFAPFEVWSAKRDGDAWRWRGGGSCRLRAVTGGLRADRWELDPAALPPGPDATKIPLWVWEGECASGQTAEGRIREPAVTYTEDAVVVMITVEPVSGECPSNPPTPFLLRLSEPLGDRQLLDGGSEPPAPPQPDPNGLGR